MTLTELEQKRLKPLTKNNCLLAEIFYQKHLDGSFTRWYRNGKTKTWIRTPSRFRIPVKHGLYRYDAITEDVENIFIWE